MLLPLNSKSNLESARQGSVKSFLRFGERRQKSTWRFPANLWWMLGWDCVGREGRRLTTEQFLSNWEKRSWSKGGQTVLWDLKDSGQPEGSKLTSGSLIPRAWNQRQWKGFDLRKAVPKRYTLKLDTIRFKEKEYITQTVSIRKPYGYIIRQNKPHKKIADKK